MGLNPSRFFTPFYPGAPETMYLLERVIQRDVTRLEEGPR
jgi:hypothetical protein